MSIIKRFVKVCIFLMAMVLVLSVISPFISGMIAGIMVMTSRYLNEIIQIILIVLAAKWLIKKLFKS